MLPYHAIINSVLWYILSYPATRPLLLLLITMSYKRKLVHFSVENCLFLLPILYYYILLLNGREVDTIFSALFEVGAPNIKEYQTI